MAGEAVERKVAAGSRVLAVVAVRWAGWWMEWRRWAHFPRVVLQGLEELDNVRVDDAFTSECAPSASNAIVPFAWRALLPATHLGAHIRRLACVEIGELVAPPSPGGGHVDGASIHARRARCIAPGRRHRLQRRLRRCWWWYARPDELDANVASPAQFLRAASAQSSLHQSMVHSSLVSRGGTFPNPMDFD